MKKTAQPGQLATNQPTPPIQDRPEQSYQKRSWIDKIIIAVVVLLAVVVIYLSFGNTAKLALLLMLNPHLAAGLVEILFGTLLFIRARQRALQKNVPLFLDIGYFFSLTFVTAVNMWGLGQVHYTGYVVGAVITGAMWLMERTLVWLWTDSDRPHEKKPREIKREINKEIEKERISQWVVWRRFEGRKPDLGLIKLAGKAEREREKVMEKGMPYFFQTEYQIDKQDQLEQMSNKQTDTEQEVKQTNKQTPGKQTDAEQTRQEPETEHRTDKQPDEQTGQVKQTAGQTNIQTKKQTDTERQTEYQTPNTKHGTEQTERQQTNKQLSRQTNKQDDNEQTNKLNSRTDKQEVKRQTNKQATEQTEQNKQAERANEVGKQTEQAEQVPQQTNKQTEIPRPNKQDNIEQTSDKQTNKQTTLNTKQTKQNKQAPNKQTDKTNVVYIADKKPTYEQLLKKLDQFYKENKNKKKKLPSVRGFAEQEGIKPNRAHTAITMWREANGWDKKQTNKAK